MNVKTGDLIQTKRTTGRVTGVIRNAVSRRIEGVVVQPKGTTLPTQCVVVNPASVTPAVTQ